MKIDCVYYISLNQQTDDYKQQVLSRISALGLPEPYSYYLVKAVNGLSIPQSERFELYPDWKIPDENLEGVHDMIRGFWNRDLTPGEIGCSLSHIHCWEDALESGHDNILILEEDLIIKRSFEYSKLFI